MSNSLSEGPDDIELDDFEREEIIRGAAALAINEFMYQLSLGYTIEVAFERAVTGETAIGVRVPSNLRIEVLL